MKEIISKLENKRILGAVGLGCLLVGLFLPYVTVKIFGFSESATLIQSLQGKLLFLAVVANAMFIFKDFVKKYIPKLFESNIGKKIDEADAKMGLIPAAVALVCLIWAYFDVKDAMGFGNSFAKDAFSYGLGFWIEWVGIIALAAHSFLYKGEVKKETAEETKKASEENKEDNISESDSNNN